MALDGAPPKSPAAAADGGPAAMKAGEADAVSHGGHEREGRAQGGETRCEQGAGSGDEMR